MSYAEEDTCAVRFEIEHMRRRIHVSYEEEDTSGRLLYIRGGGYMCHMRRRIHVRFGLK